jgi:lipopolysaccharide biosynthesis protein
MSALQALINQKNQWNAIFKGEQFEIKTAAGRQRVASMIDSDLSPENLTCDGEMPRSQVQARYRALTAAAKELVKLDPSVKIYELS